MRFVTLVTCFYDVIIRDRRQLDAVLRHIVDTPARG